MSEIKEWEASLWPNNQPPIMLGVYQAETEKAARKIVCEQNGIREDDDCLSIVLNGEDTPIKRWRKH